MAEYLQVTLANIGDGTMDERFNRALQKVIENICDPNTPAQAKRSISIDVVIIPDENREQASVVIDVDQKLAPQKRKLSQIHFVMDRNTARTKAVTATFEQKGLFDPSEASSQFTSNEAAARKGDAPAK